MLGNYVNCTHVVSSVTLYRSSVVDLSHSRAVHAVEHDPCCPDPVLLQGSTCQAVHYGLCSPLLKLPPFVIPITPLNSAPVVKTQTPPSTPTILFTSTPLAKDIPSTPTSPISPVSPSKGHPLNFISGFDPVQLLADTDLEGQLEALVTSFVAQDKVRLASRRSQNGPTAAAPNGESFNGPEGSKVNEVKERRIIRRPGVEVVGGKLVPVVQTQKSVQQPVAVVQPTLHVTKPSTPEYRRDGGGVKAQINRFAPNDGVNQVGPHSPPGNGIGPDPNKVVYPTKDINQQQKQPVVNEQTFKKVYEDERLAKGHQQRAVNNKPDQLRNGSDPLAKWALPSYDFAAASLGLDTVHLMKLNQPQPKALSPERLLPSYPGEGAPTIPHPKLTTAQKQHMKERSLSPTDRHNQPVRPFLTKGSVAERVLLFERAPSIERTQAVHPAAINSIQSPQGCKASLLSGAFRGALASGLHSEKDKENVEPGFLKTGSLRKLPKTATRATHNIPRFFYPNGKPLDTESTEEHLRKIAKVFAACNNKASLDHFGSIAKACNLPLYCKGPLFQAAGGDKKGVVECEAFLDYWRRVITASNEEASMFIRILSKGNRNYIISEDFIFMIQDIIQTHPGLTFLREAPEFHSRYVHTVIARIFYCVNRSWTGKITSAELRKSHFLRVLHLLEEEEDINQVTEYFSYEHFYVIYCKFWELDRDHDLFIDKADLSRHNDGAISSRMINRIFSGAVTRGPVLKLGKMSYSEFVWFLISEEDKRHPRSIEYWFRCMDIDGDGFLSMYELEYFYDEQLHRMESLGIETLPFRDCLCQMLDMIRPKVPGCISLSDLKNCKLTGVFFDTFFNLEKYLDHEQRDPFASQRDHDDDLSISDWDRFAAEEYELLVSEENANGQQEDLMYEEYDENDLGVQFEKMTQGINSLRPDNDEDYDYAESDVDYPY